MANLAAISGKPTWVTVRLSLRMFGVCSLATLCTGPALATVLGPDDDLEVQDACRSQEPPSDWDCLALVLLRQPLDVGGVLS